MKIMGSISYTRSNKLLPKNAVKFGLGLQCSDFIFLSKLVNINCARHNWTPNYRYMEHVICMGETTICIKLWLGNVILHNYPCCTCSICPQVHILQSKPGEGVSKQEDILPHIGMCHGNCKWTAKWWAIQPEWSVCSNNKDGRCKPNIGSWRHDLPHINYTVWADRQEGWHRQTCFHIFLFLHFLT